MKKANCCKCGRQILVIGEPVGNELCMLCGAEEDYASGADAPTVDESDA